MAKGSTFFCQTDFIESSAEIIFSSLNSERANWPTKGSHSLWCEELARYYGDINALHPFREGNGRVQRLFFNQLVKEYGYLLDWSQTSQKEMLHASIESFSGRMQPLKTLIGRCLSPAHSATQQDSTTSEQDPGL